MNDDVCPYMNFRSEHLSEEGLCGMQPRPLTGALTNQSCWPHTGHSALTSSVENDSDCLLFPFDYLMCF